MKCKPTSISLERAIAEPESFYWELIGQGLKWIDEFADEHGGFPDQLHNLLLEQFKLIGELGSQRVVRFHEVRQDNGQLVKVKIDLLEHAQRTAPTAEAAIRSVFAYVRMRISLAARASARKERRRAKLLAESIRGGHTAAGLVSEESTPIEAAERAEAIAVARATIGKEDYGMLLERFGRGTSERSIARTTGTTRYRVHQRCDRALAVVASALNVKS